MHSRPLAVVLLNPSSGRAESIVASPERLVRALDSRLDVQVKTLREGEDIAAMASAAVGAGASVVVAGGGDGTVSAVASALVDTPVALGILPLGTGNSLAEALGLPKDVEAACEVVANGERRAIDTARVGDRFMVLMASIGLSARAVTETSAEAKERFGTVAYLGKALDVILDQEPFDVLLELPEQPPLRATAHAVTVANLVPARSILSQGPPSVVGDDGLLDVTVVAFTGLFDALATSLHLYERALAGMPADRDGVAFTRARRVSISASPPQELMIDGELAGTTPFTVVCHPASLNVLVAG